MPNLSPENRIYPHHVFAELCDVARVSSEQHDSLRNGLEWAAREWRSEKDASCHSMTQKKRSELLTFLGTNAGACSEFLKSLPVSIWNDVAAAGSYFCDPLCDPAIRPSSTNPWDDGAAALPYVTMPNIEDGNHEVVSMDVNKIRDALDVISEMAFAAEAVFTKVHSGPQTDFLLRRWIHNMRRVWTDGLGRNFTRRFTDDGKPLSPAAVLCVFAYRHLDPKTPPSLINSEMKKRIAEDRKNTDGKNYHQMSKHSSRG